MKLSELSKREKTILASFSIIAISAIVFSVGEYVISRARTMDKKILAKSISIEKDRELLARYDRLKKEDQRHPLPVTSVNGDQEATNMIGSVQALANKCSCVITSVRPREAKKIGDYRGLSLDLSVEGTINDLAKFYYELESQSQPIRIEQFTITSSSASSDQLKSNLMVSRLVAG